MTEKAKSFSIKNWSQADQPREKLRDKGKAILLISVELDEILSLSDRIAVMFDGSIMGERLASETDEKELGLLMAGVKTGTN